MHRKSFLGYGILLAVAAASTIYVRDRMQRSVAYSHLKESLEYDSPAVQKGSGASQFKVLFATNRSRPILDEVGMFQRVQSHDAELKGLELGEAVVVINDDHRRGRFEVDREVPGIALQTTGRLESRAFFEQLREMVHQSEVSSLLLFVHGYNVTFDHSLMRAAQVAHDLGFEGGVVAYSWPSQGATVKYSADSDLARWSTGSFAEFVYRLSVDLDPETELHMLVHSMGNRLCLYALRQLPDDRRSQLWLHRRWSNVVLAAPDVGGREFSNLAGPLRRLSQRVTVYSAKNDWALVASQLANGDARVGQTSALAAEHAFEVVDVRDLKSDWLGHSYYGSDVRVIEDLRRIIAFDQPASERSWLSKQSKNVWHFDPDPRRIAAAPISRIR